MGVAEVLAGEDGPFPVPHTYTLSPGEAFEPTTVAATFDGSGAAGTFMPCLSFYSQDGRLLGRSFPSSTVTAGNSAVVTYSPFALTASSTTSGGGSEHRREAIALMNPAVQTDGGNSFPNVAVVTGADLGSWAYVQAVEGIVYGNVMVPLAVDTTVAGSIILAIASAAGTGNVAMKVGTKQLADAVAFNPVGFTVETAVVTTIGAATTVKFVTCPLTNALVAGDLMLVEVIRAGNTGSDTLAGTVLLLGAWLDLTVTG